MGSDRISLDEFIEDLLEDQPVLRDGYELGLVIDESNGSTDRLATLLREVAQRTPTTTLSIEELLKPSRAKDLVSAVNDGNTLVLLHADTAILPHHYKHLRDLVSYHSLEEWRDNGSVRGMVRFHQGSRFVLVLSRQMFTQALREFPPLPEILGISLSLDSTRAQGEVSSW